MHINRQTYEEFFLLYADGELNGTEKKAVEDFVKENPDLASEFNMIQDTVMRPDDSIIFENKELLYKNEEEDRKIVYMRWLRIGVAAAVARWRGHEARRMAEPLGQQIGLMRAAMNQHQAPAGPP